uniref:Zorya protein ZorC EH domain-containing protein n=1 Tax=Streptomyces sp. NBC_00003 TaxID=2903608 RepID=A0AAU2V1A6_9ACTN
MTGQDPHRVLPSEFLITAMTHRSPDDPVVRLAAQQVRSDLARYDRSVLAEALLTGPHAEEAPLWLLEAAAATGLEAETETSRSDRRPTLVALVLGHPSCPASLREQTLKRCAAEQLAQLGGPLATERLAGAVAAEMRARGGTPPPMTPRLLEEPTLAQIAFRQGPLHDLVFAAARDALPTTPDVGEPGEGADIDDWLKRHRQAYEAWESMWREILKLHPRRHRELVEWADGTDAERTIRDELLGSLPWEVEPELLVELASVDLGRFPFEVLVAQGCRMRRGGADEQQVLDHFAADLSALTDEEQDHFRHYLGRRSTTLIDLGCRAPVAWVQHTASGTWRHLLNPAQAKDGYRSVDWRASATTLADLAARFAETAAQALAFWESGDRYSAIGLAEVAWVRDMMLHLPTVTEDVKAGVRPIVRGARKKLSSGHPGLQPRYDQRRELEEILDTIERVLADPPPAVGADRRRSALGAPDEVTVRGLAGVQAQALGEYLDRHPGDDALVEKALLACAASGYRSDDNFEKVLRRHGLPNEALLRLTEGLRTNLGGGPSWREAWTRLILARPDAERELVRALPAWSALRARDGSHGSAHPAVVSVVREALGTDQDAWDRFANCPATHSGPTAWLRLSDLLDAAATGAPWPKPPGSR